VRITVRAAEVDDLDEVAETWAEENISTHMSLVMVRDDVIIGMAWLATTKRVPIPHAVQRASGDVQGVYVTAERDNGLGGQLIEALLDQARELGLERVTVHSSIRAIPAYARHGFTSSPRLLQAETAH
jgi:GNAT superfamily N-acetyltransferase